MKKMGTIIALRSDELNATLYLAEGNILTPNIKGAKVFRASTKVRDTIRAQAIAKYPGFNFVASEVERWTDNV